MPQRHRLDVEEGAPAARSAVQAQRLVRGERHLRRRRLRVALDRRAEEPEAVPDVGGVGVDDLDVRGVSGRARCVADAFGAAERSVGQQGVDRRARRQRSVRCVTRRGEHQHDGDGEKCGACGQSATDRPNSKAAHRSIPCSRPGRSARGCQRSISRVAPKGTRTRLARPRAAMSTADPAATILLVEDDAPTRTFLADNLTADGYELLVADCARDGLRLLETKFPDLALVDLGLPDGSGLDLVRRVRAADGVASRVDPAVPLVVAQRARGRARPAARVRARVRRLRLQAVQLPRAARAGRGAAAPRRRAPAARAPARRRARGRPGGARRAPARHAGRALPEGVRAPAHAGLRPHARVHEGGAAAHVWGFRSMGSTRTLDSHACRLRHKLGARRRPLRGQRVGRRLPAGRRALGGARRSAEPAPAAGAGRRGGGAAVAGGRPAARGGAARAVAAGGPSPSASAAFWRLQLLRGRELVARACHELRGPLTAAHLALHGGARHGEPPPARVAAIERELDGPPSRSRTSRPRAAGAARPTATSPSTSATCSPTRR